MISKPHFTIEDYGARYLAGIVPVVGSHSAAELRELLAAKDYEIFQIQAAFDKLPAPTSANVIARQAWAADFQALRTRYALARARAQAAIDSNTILPASLSGAETEWQDVLHAIKQIDGQITRGDLQDVYNRIVLLGAQVDESHVPQPSASSDAELVAFKGLDAGLRAGEAAVDRATHSDTAMLLGLGIAVVGLGVLAYAIKK